MRSATREQGARSDASADVQGCRCGRCNAALKTVRVRAFRPLGLRFRPRCGVARWCCVSGLSGSRAALLLQVSTEAAAGSVCHWVAATAAQAAETTRGDAIKMGRRLRDSPSSLARCGAVTDEVARPRAATVRIDDTGQRSASVAPSPRRRSPSVADSADAAPDSAAILSVLDAYRHLIAQGCAEWDTEGHCATPGCLVVWMLWSDDDGVFVRVELPLPVRSCAHSGTRCQRDPLKHSLDCRRVIGTRKVSSTTSWRRRDFVG